MVTIVATLTFHYKSEVFRVITEKPQNNTANYKGSKVWANFKPGQLLQLSLTCTINNRLHLHVWEHATAALGKKHKFQTQKNDG